MRILAIGDIVGEKAVEKLDKELNKLKQKEKVDVVIANGENAANGNGLSKELFGKILASGVDIVTMGNHTWGNEEIYSFIDDSRIIRPANITKGMPGKGYTIYQKDDIKILVINLIGRRMMEGVYYSDNPFMSVQEILESVEKDIKIIMVDFHAQSTGEKFNMGYFLDGKVSSVYGTHTHVQTADETILKKGTGFITDIGMTGPCYSDLGCDVENSINRYIKDMPVGDIISDHEIMINGCIFDIDENTGKTIKVRRVHID